MNNSGQGWQARSGAAGPAGGVRAVRPRGFTLIELLVVIAIISLLVSILTPSLVAAKNMARRAVCMSNLHGIGVLCHVYLGDADAAWPPYITREDGGLFYLSNGSPTHNITGYKISWMDLILAGDLTPKLFDCPAKETPEPQFEGSWSSTYPLPADYPYDKAVVRNYAYDQYLSSYHPRPAATIRPSEIVVATDGWYQGGEVYGTVTGESLYWRDGDYAWPHDNGGGIQVLLCDGHAEWFPRGVGDWVAGSGSLYDLSRWQFWLPGSAPALPPPL